MSEERWLPIPGFEGLYEVSDAGRVRSTPRRGTSGGLLTLKRIKRGGYLAVDLFRSSRGTRRTVHSLVLEAFIGPRPEEAEIRHLDGNPENAHFSNLAYGTSTENQLDKRQHGTDHNVRKTHCPQGHPYTEANTRVIPSRPGARYCRTCEAARGKGTGPLATCPDFDTAWNPEATQ